MGEEDESEEEEDEEDWESGEEQEHNQEDVDTKCMRPTGEGAQMDWSGAEMAAAAATEGALGEEVAGKQNEAIATEVVQRTEEVGEHSAETAAADGIAKGEQEQQVSLVVAGCRGKEWGVRSEEESGSERRETG